jgi:tRNA(Phe) wybutosine-synthesizing methylase Tyw3
MTSALFSLSGSRFSAFCCFTGGKLIFRFEAFLLHAECRSMATAQQLLSVARQAGFRESGAMGKAALSPIGMR